MPRPAIHLTAARFWGYKGAPEETIQFGPATVMLGRNGAGKTEVLDAILVTLLGYHPTAGRGGVPARTNPAILTLAGGDELGGELTFDVDGAGWRILRRFWWSTVTRGRGKGERKSHQEVRVVPPAGLLQPDQTGGEAEGTIRELIGGPAGLDLGLLLAPSSTDTDRWVAVFRVAAGRSTWTPDRVAAELPAPRFQPAWQPEKTTLAEWAAAEWAKAKAAQKEARATADSTREALAGLRQDATPVDPRRVAELREAEATATAHAQQVATATGRAEERAKAEVEKAQAARNRQEAARAELATVTRDLAALAGRQAPVAEVARLQAEIEELADGLGPESVASLQAGVRKAEAAKEALRAEQEAWDAALPELDLPPSPLAGVRVQLLDVDEQISRLSQAVSQADENFDTPTCPLCERDLDPARIGVLEARQTELRGRLATLETEADAAEQARRRENDNRRAISQGVARRIEAQRQHANQLRQQERAQQAALADLRLQLATLQAQSADQQTAALQERQRALQVVVAQPVPGPVELDVLWKTTETRGEIERGRAQEAARAATDERTKAETDLREIQRIAQKRVDLDQAEQALESATAYATSVGPKGLMGAITAEVLPPLLESVQATLQAMGYQQTFEIATLSETEEPVFRPGLRGPRGWAPVETISGGEGVACSAALLKGLAVLAGSPWVLFRADELQSISLAERERFLAAVVGMVERGEVSQFIGAGCPDTEPSVPGLTVIRRG